MLGRVQEVFDLRNRLAHFKPDDTVHQGGPTDLADNGGLGGLLRRDP